MLKILFDQNFNHRIVRGVQKRIPELDSVTTQILNKEREIDTRLLRLAFKQERVIVTHDRQTFPGFVYHQLEKGHQSFGVIVVSTKISIGEAIDDLEFLIKNSAPDEFADQVRYLPLRSPI